MFGCELFWFFSDGCFYGYVPIHGNEGVVRDDVDCGLAEFEFVSSQVVDNF